MKRNLQTLSAREYDLLVVGGGINGAAVASMAAGRGLKTALIEKGDFASGTSSKSTKLLHGGLRYLENFEFDLVWESLHERYIQLQVAPHLAQPLAFLIPVYKGDPRPLWMMRLGVFLYEMLAGRYRVGRRQALSRDELLRLEPGIKPDGLRGGLIYYDAQMDDARLCLENALTAREKGADVFNYVAAESFLKENGRTVGVMARDVMTNATVAVRARKTLCAAGPWTNGLLRLDDPNAKEQVRTTKGIHIVVRGQLTQRALFIMSYRDKRIFFVIPWLGNSLIGTTDTDYTGGADDVTVEQADIDYLTTEAKRIFPSYDFGARNIVASFAGLRPLLRTDAALPSSATRKHFIYETPSGMIVVVGGKYTTYRAIAEACVNRVTTLAREQEFRVYGSGPVGDVAAAAAKYGLPLDTVTAISQKYGSRYEDVLKLTRDDPALKEPICSCSPFIRAQVVYAIETEMALTAEDVASRRLLTAYLPCATKNCDKVINEYVARHRAAN
jgi:glycerol-3-phosphate dehydrogenase